MPMLSWSSGNRLIIKYKFKKKYMEHLYYSIRFLSHSMILLMLSFIVQFISTLIIYPVYKFIFQLIHGRNTLFIESFPKLIAFAVTGLVYSLTLLCVINSMSENCELSRELLVVLSILSISAYINMPEENERLGRGDDLIFYRKVRIVIGAFISSLHLLFFVIKMPRTCLLSQWGYLENNNTFSFYLVFHAIAAITIIQFGLRSFLSKVD